MNDALLTLIDRSLTFEYLGGDVTPVELPHTTGWRTLPFAVTAQTVPGEGTLEVTGQPIFRGHAGEAICIPPGVLHKCTLVSGSGVSRWSVVNYTIGGGVNLLHLLNVPFVIKRPGADRIAEVNTRLAELVKLPQSLQTTVERKQLGLALLGVVLQHATWRGDGESAVVDSQRLAPVFSFVTEHLERPLRLDDLARRAHLSPSRFHGVFRRLTGASPLQYVQRLRLEKAQQLLLTTDLSIAEIAQRAGHRDPFLFSRVFKKKCGASPTVYRENSRKPAI